MTKLSKAQAKIIGGNKPGDKLWSNPLVATNTRTIEALMVHGHLKITGISGSMIEYTVQDTPEVRACNAERDAAYAEMIASMANQITEAEDRRAAAQPATVNAEAWTPSGHVVIGYTETPEGKSIPAYADDEPAPTASAGAVTPADLSPFAPSETDCANEMKLIDQQTEKIEALEAFYDLARKLGVTWDMWELVSHRDDNSWTDANGILHRLHEAGYEIDDPYIHNPDAPQRETRPEHIARLQRDLEAARASSSALRRFYDLACNLDLNSDMYQICWEQGGELAIEYIQLKADLDNLGIKWETAAPDNGQRVSAEALRSALRATTAMLDSQASKVFIMGVGHRHFDDVQELISANRALLAE